MTQYFIISRFFSGLFESIETNCWNPMGVPAVTKMMEEISKQNSLTWLIVCKNARESSVVKNKRSIKRLNRIVVHILPYKSYTKSGKMDAFINEIIAFIYIFKISHCLKTKKLFYIDTSNILIGAMVKIFLRKPVILRILGIKNLQRKLISGMSSKLINPLQYLAYKVPYDLAICTQDGSGVEFNTYRLLNKKTKIEIMLNGVTKVSCKPYEKQPGKVNLLFVGKLENQKGIIELLESLALLKEINSHFKLRVVGKGYLVKHIERFIEKNGLKKYVTLVGSVSHSQIAKYYEMSDVYISINKMGNLSNTVLEAMSAGKCIIILNKDDKAHIDEYTEKIIPPDAVIRVERNNIVYDLVKNLDKLICHPEIVSKYVDSIVNFSKTFLWTWDERIKNEMMIIGKL